MGILFRIVIFLLIIFFVLSWFKRLGFKHRQQAHVHNQKKPVPPVSGEQQTMARCCYCGVFVPQDMMVRGRDGLYCSEQHRAFHQTKS